MRDQVKGSWFERAGNGWGIAVGPLEVHVHHVMTMGSRWYLSTSPRVLFQRPLESTEVAGAQAEALLLVREWLDSALAALPACPEQAEGSPE